MAVLRLDPKSRRDMIVKAAVAAAKRDGLLHLSHAATAELCMVETSEATVRRYFHTALDLREAVQDADPKL